jgi:hypothetical protein
LAGWITGKDTLALPCCILQRDTADGSFTQFLDPVFRFSRAIPVRRNKAAFGIEYLHKIFPGIRGCNMRIAVSFCFFEHGTLDIVEQVLNIGFYAIESYALTFLWYPFSLSPPHYSQDRLAPMAMRTGTPFNSYSANFQPGLALSESSYFTEMPSAFSLLTIRALFHRSGLSGQAL